MLSARASWLLNIQKLPEARSLTRTSQTKARLHIQHDDLWIKDRRRTFYLFNIRCLVHIRIWNVLWRVPQRTSVNSSVWQSKHHNTFKFRKKARRGIIHVLYLDYVRCKYVMSLTLYNYALGPFLSCVDTSAAGYPFWWRHHVLLCTVREIGMPYWYSRTNTLWYIVLEVVR
jgi:hypothetical protein